MTVPIASDTEDVSSLSRSMAAVGIGGSLPRATRLRTESEKAALLEKDKPSSEKAALLEKDKPSSDSRAPSVISTTASLNSEKTINDVKPWIRGVRSARDNGWILDEKLARGRSGPRSPRGAFDIKIRYGNINDTWEVYTTSPVWRLKRSFAYDWARGIGPDALNFHYDGQKMKDNLTLGHYGMEDGDIIDVLPDFSRIHGG